MVLGYTEFQAGPGYLHEKEKKKDKGNGKGKKGGRGEGVAARIAVLTCDLRT